MRRIVLPLLALFVALGGPAFAAKVFTGADVKDHSLSKRDFSARAVRGLQLTPARSVSQYALRSRAVTKSKLAPGSVGGIQVADGTLTGTDFRRNSVFGLGAGAVTHSELQDNAVRLAQLQDGSIDQTKLTPNSVGTEEVSGLRLMDLFGVQTVVTVTYGEIAPGQCAMELMDVGERLGRTVSVGHPATFPDDVILTARRGTTRVDVVRITACNHGDAAVTPGAQAIPVLALR